MTVVDEELVQSVQDPVEHDRGETESGDAEPGTTGSGATGSGTTESGDEDAGDADTEPIPRRSRGRVVRRTIGACVLTFVATTGWSAGRALTAPGTDSAQARLAEWGRDHHLGPVVTQLEQWQYQLNPPKAGGAPDQTEIAKLASADSAAHGAGGATLLDDQFRGREGHVLRDTRTSVPVAPDVLIHAPMTSPAASPLQGEGEFHAVVTDAAGLPVVQAALVRPDARYTSKFVGVAWLSGRHVRFVLHPGSEGGAASMDPVGNRIGADQRKDLIALFNGGFKLAESEGGFYDHGNTVRTLRDGAASEVLFKDGSLKVGQWGRDFTLTPDVVSVRQNLKLMVDNGSVVPAVNRAASWGITDNSALAVPRSGVGMTAQGDLVYVGGPDLTAAALADLLQRAGATYGMQLDINRGWPTFQYFPQRDGNPDASQMIIDYQRPATRFFDNSTKDFMAVYTR